MTNCMTRDYRYKASRRCGQWSVPCGPIYADSTPQGAVRRRPLSLSTLQLEASHTAPTAPSTQRSNLLDSARLCPNSTREVATQRVPRRPSPARLSPSRVDKRRLVAPRRAARDESRLGHSAPSILEPARPNQPSPARSSTLPRSLTSPLAASAEGQLKVVLPSRGGALDAASSAACLAASCSLW